MIPITATLTTLLLTLRTNPITSQTTDDYSKSARQGAPCPPGNELPCKNSGYCEMGLADFGYHADLEIPFLNATHIDYMHCECPDGFTGVMCEHMVETCGDAEHACFNGAECVDALESGYNCDCDSAVGNTAWAGHFCEHAATHFCEYGVAVSKNAFCVNGGSCKNSVVAGESHPGCDCPQGFTGDHCEFTPGSVNKVSSSPERTSTASESAPVPGTGTTSQVLSFSFLMAVVGASVLIAAVFIVRHVVSDRNMRAGQNEPIGAPIEIEADGGTMPESSENKVELTPSTADQDVDGEFI